MVIVACFRAGVSFGSRVIATEEKGAATWSRPRHRDVGLVEQRPEDGRARLDRGWRYARGTATSAEAVARRHEVDLPLPISLREGGKSQRSGSPITAS